MIRNHDELEVYMSKVFFEELELPQPDIYLGVGFVGNGQRM